MVKYILKRLLYIIPTFIALTFIVYGILAASPNDPAVMILGPLATEEELDAQREDLGLNDPFLIRYAKYMGNLAQGDLGTSWVNSNSIFKELAVRLPNTLRLTAYALILTILVGIPLGVVAAVYQYSVVDKLTLVFAMLFISMPGFFLALICQLIFCLKLKWLPATGFESFSNYILPSIMLGAGQIASMVRMTRSSMLDVISQDYTRTAYAKGCSKRRVIIYHALRNGLLPVVTGIGNALIHLVSGAAVIEIIFAIPGLGAMLINGVRTMDVPVVMGPVIISSLLICIINVLVDIVYAFIDPRVKIRFSSGG